MSHFSVLPTTGSDLARAVPEAEYKRLLSVPRSRPLDGQLLERATSAREWYASNGRPFAATAKIELKNISTPVVELTNGVELCSVELAQRLRTGEAHALVVLAASAGTEVADEVARHWAEGHPDEAFFLDRFAVAVTEQLIQWSSAFLCRAGEPSRETLLPHLSPGCGRWDLSDQHRLVALLTDGTRVGPLELLPSGALHTQHSIMAALGVTHLKFATMPRDICQGCDLDPCTFRRAPYRG